MIGGPGIAAIWAALPEARIVGGAVRDHLAGRPIADVDWAVPLTPEAVMARARETGLGVIPTGLAHGTVTVLAEGQNFEVTALRRDVATDGRHAVVAFTQDWEVDASRRDFTINAMSATQDGEIHDYFGGRADLVAGRVRFVGIARQRITEDYLRILRFFRFWARYGVGAPDAEAVAAIRALRAGVKGLSAERVWTELKRILAAPEPRPAVALMQETGVLEMIFKEPDLARFARLAKTGDPVLRVAALLREPAEDFGRRWRLSLAEQARLAALAAPNTLAPEMDEAALRRALADEPKEILLDRIRLVEDDRPGWSGLRARLEAMERPVFPLLGRDVMALGVPPGPRVGEVLRAAREWWLDAGCAADPAACLAWVAEWVRTQGEVG